MIIWMPIRLTILKCFFLGKLKKLRGHVGPLMNKNKDLMILYR